MSACNVLVDTSLDTWNDGTVSSSDGEAPKSPNIYVDLEEAKDIIEHNRQVFVLLLYNLMHKDDANGR